MKDTFLYELKELLSRTNASKEEIEEIVNDYDQLYEDALLNFSDESQIKNYLGTPEAIVNELKDTFKPSKPSKNKNKLVAVSPFISIILFFFIGFYLNAFHLAWLSFMLIPIIAVSSNGGFKKNITPLTVFASVIAFFLIGFYLNAWHPGWMVFLAIPISAILFSTDSSKGVIVGLMPFVSLILFLSIGYLYGIYHPTWLIFLSIPMVAVLFHKSLLHKILYELCFVTAIGLYLYLGYTYGIWRYGAIVFIIPLAYAVLSDDVKFFISTDMDKPATLKVGLVFVFALVTYVLLSVAFNRGFAWGWLVLLTVPVYAIIAFGPRPIKIVSVMPFVSITLFYVLGFFFNLWHVSWLAFLLIPITAILEE